VAGEQMRAVDIIEKKKRAKELDAAEIEWFIRGYVSGEIPDYQASAWLMAVWFNGMTARETAALTLAMAHSGDMVDLSAVSGRKVDKHSTGGVGDTTTLVAAPLAAACGLNIAKMSGRGLGHTGGTLDKLESIPGVITAQTAERFLDIVQKTGLAVVGQSTNLTPADKKLYALRDVTATVDSLPLIAASIMSKKLAAGADAIVLDVKAGSGAFMGSLDGARALAQAMVDLGREAGRQTVAYITDMNQPLGRAVGNGLEVAEAVEILNGKHRDGRLCSLSLELGAEMLVLGGIAKDHGQGLMQMRAALAGGDGLRRFKAMAKELGGDTAYLDNPDRLCRTKWVLDAPSGSSGWLTAMDVREMGRAAQLLGAGRAAKDDAIDPAVGYIMLKELGDRVSPGEPVAKFYINDERKGREAMEVFSSALQITQEPKPVPPLVYEVVR
jgi:pyrimidine-nucleoside phosphorylase